MGAIGVHIIVPQQATGSKNYLFLIQRITLIKSLASRLDVITTNTVVMKALIRISMIYYFNWLVIYYLLQDG
jgi:hypothetical protein